MTLGEALEVVGMRRSASTTLVYAHSLYSEMSVTVHLDIHEVS
jgi:hypothetical protein